MLAEETFMDLFRSAAHWEFELFLELLTGIVFGKLIWGYIRRHIHKDDKSMEERIIEEVDKRFDELVAHMHEDTGITHTVGYDPEAGDGGG